jgi:hypothetical protein
MGTASCMNTATHLPKHHVTIILEFLPQKPHPTPGLLAQIAGNDAVVILAVGFSKDHILKKTARNAGSIVYGRRAAKRRDGAFDGGVERDQSVSIVVVGVALHLADLAVVGKLDKRLLKMTSQR